MPDALHFTDDDAANTLIAKNPLALLIGFVLDQQVNAQTAFSGPLKLEQRLGRLDAAEIAGLDPGRLEEVFREKPAIHRFPGNMARRVQELCATIVSEYGGDAAERLDGCEGRRRPAQAHRLAAGLRPDEDHGARRGAGEALRRRVAEPLVPKHPTLGDVDSREQMERYQAAKREHKAKMRAEAH